MQAFFKAKTYNFKEEYKFNSIKDLRIPKMYEFLILIFHPKKLVRIKKIMTIVLVGAITRTPTIK